MTMLGIWLAAFGGGVVIGTIFEMLTWDEDRERQKMEFNQNKKDVKF